MVHRSDTSAVLPISHAVSRDGFHLLAHSSFVFYSAQAEGRGPSLKMQFVFFFFFGRLPVIQLLIDKFQSSDVLFSASLASYSGEWAPFVFRIFIIFGGVDFRSYADTFEFFECFEFFSRTV